MVSVQWFSIEYSFFLLHFVHWTCGFVGVFFFFFFFLFYLISPSIFSVSFSVFQSTLQSQTSSSFPSVCSTPDKQSPTANASLSLSHSHCTLNSLSGPLTSHLDRFPHQRLTPRLNPPFYFYLPIHSHLLKKKKKKEKEKETNNDMAAPASSIVKSAQNASGQSPLLTLRSFPSILSNPATPRIPLTGRLCLRDRNRLGIRPTVLYLCQQGSLSFTLLLHQTIHVCCSSPHIVSTCSLTVSNFHSLIHSTEGEEATPCFGQQVCSSLSSSPLLHPLPLDHHPLTIA
jgi:hypothetical protein